MRSMLLSMLRCAAVHVYCRGAILTVLQCPSENEMLKVGGTFNTQTQLGVVVSFLQRRPAEWVDEMHTVARLG